MCVDVVQNRPAVTTSVTATVDSKEALHASLRLSDPRVAAIKSAAATVVSSESEDTDASNGGGTSSQAGDSSPGSQSPPALERVERLADKELSEDGVLIPPRPLAQWGVSESFHCNQCCCFCLTFLLAVSTKISCNALCFYFCRLCWGE